MNLTKKQTAIVNALRKQGVPAEWAILAAQRADNSGLSIEAVDEGFADYLAGAFWWGSSPEGRDFWASVADAADAEEHK